MAALDLENLLALVHASPPEGLPALLERIMADPVEGADGLRVFVPEVLLVLERVRLRSGPETGVALREAFRAPIERFRAGLEQGAEAGAEVRVEMAFLLGRLAGALDALGPTDPWFLPADLLQQINGPTPVRAILLQLCEAGSLTSRGIRQRLEPGWASSLSPAELHRVLAELVRYGLVSSETRRQTLYYHAQPLTRQLLEADPGWMNVVAESFRMWRTGSLEGGTPLHERLVQRFKAQSETAPCPGSPSGDGRSREDL